MKNGFLITLFGALVLSCTTRQVWDTIQTADEIHREYPDSALALLDAISPDQLKSDKARADYSLTKGIVLNKLRMLKDSDSVLTPAIDYFKLHGTDEQRMKLLYCLASSKHHTEKPEEYVVLLTRTKYYAQELNNNKYIAMSSHLLGHYFMKEELYNEAKKQYTDALCYYEKDLNHRYDVSLNILLASIAIKQHKFEVALQQLEKATLASDESTSIGMLAQINIYYAFLFANRRPADFKKCLDYMIKAQSYGNFFTSQDYAFYAHIYDKLGQKDSAAYYLEKAHIKARTLRDSISILSFFDNTYADEGKFEKAYPYLKIIYDYKDSLNRTLKEQSLALVHRDYFQHLSEEKENDIRQKELQKRTYMIISFILILLFVFAVVYRKKESKRNLQRLTTLAEDLKKRIDSKTEENEQLKEKLRDSYQGQFRRLGELVETVHLAKSDSEKGSLGRKVYEITREISSPSAQKELEAKLNSEIDNIMKHLRQDFPRLKEKDFLFFAYMIIGFDVTQISIVLNMSIGSVYTKRFRLREKISGADSPHKEQYCRWLL